MRCAPSSIRSLATLSGTRPALRRTRSHRCPCARPGGRLLGIHSHGHDPGPNSQRVARRATVHDHASRPAAAARKPAARHAYNFNAYADSRAISLRHAYLADRDSASIGTSICPQPERCTTSPRSTTPAGRDLGSQAYITLSARAARAGSLWFWTVLRHLAKIEHWALIHGRRTVTTSGDPLLEWSLEMLPARRRRWRVHGCWRPARVICLVTATARGRFVDDARAVRAAGFNRTVSGGAAHPTDIDLSVLMSTFRTQVRRVLIVAGDATPPVGPYRDSLRCRSGVLQGYQAIGFAAHPGTPGGDAMCVEGSATSRGGVRMHHLVTQPSRRNVRVVVVAREHSVRCMWLRLCDSGCCAMRDVRCQRSRR